jgi:quinol monooxygenase YgiN
MAVTVIFELQIKSDQIDTAKKTFKEILPDTRAYDGFEDIYVTENQDKPGNLILVEKWETREKYEKYLSWRTETGAVGQLGAMCEGAPSVRFFDTVDA